MNDTDFEGEKVGHMMEMVVVVLVGAMAAVLANRGIAVFNDGLRPIVPENIEGRLNRRELALTSFAMGFGLVVGFGIPFTLTASIILITAFCWGQILSAFPRRTINGEFPWRR